MGNKRADLLLKECSSIPGAVAAKKRTYRYKCAGRTKFMRSGYHGLRAKNKTFNATMITDFDDNIGKIGVR